MDRKTFDELFPDYNMNTVDPQAPYGSTDIAERYAKDPEFAALVESLWKSQRSNMDKPTERAPLLSDEADAAINKFVDPAHHEAATLINNWWKAKITSGELMPRGPYPEGPWPVDVSPLLRGDVTTLRVPMVKDGRIEEPELRVVKKVHLRVIANQGTPFLQCPECMRPYDGIHLASPKHGEFCRCGAQIVKG